MHGHLDSLLTTGELARRAAFRIGSVAVEPSTRTVTGPGGTTQVEPRVMQVMMTLAEAGGAVVSRDQLFARCWGNVYVGDDSLNRAIAGVRKVATGVAGGSFEIETVPRTGYRLKGEVCWVDEEGASAEKAESGAAEGQVSRRALLVGATAACGAIGLATWWGTRSQPDPAAPLLEQSRVAMRSSTPDGQRRAIQLLQEAVTRYPRSAAAWGLLALTTARVDEHAIGKPVTSANQVDEAASRALALGPDNADALSARAVAIPYYGDWLAAEQRFDRVLAAHPNHVFTKDSRSFLLGAVGRMQESARDRLAIAVEDVFDADMQNRLIYAHWFLEQVPEADRTAVRGLEMWPRHPAIWFARLWVLAGTGRLDRALAHVEDSRQRPDLPPPMLSTLRASLKAAQTRQPSDIEGASNQVIAGVARSVAAVVNGIMLLNLMGAADQAFTLARAYYLEQGPIIAAMDWRPGQPFVPDQRRRKTNMLFTPIASTMHRDERFMPLMEEMGLTDYWRRRGIAPDFQRDTPR